MSLARALRTAARVTPTRSAMSVVLRPSATSVASTSRSILAFGPLDAFDAGASSRDDSTTDLGTTDSRPWGWMRALPRICSSSLASCHRRDATPIASPGTGGLRGLRATGRPRRRLGLAPVCDWSDDGADAFLLAPLLAVRASPFGRSGSAVRTLGRPDVSAPSPSRVARGRGYAPRHEPATPTPTRPPIRLHPGGFRTSVATAPRRVGVVPADAVHRTKRHRACTPELASVDMTPARVRAPAHTPPHTDPFRAERGYP